MKVLMIHTFHHPRGGDTTYAALLVRLLEEAGHRVVPLAMRHPDNDPSPWEQRWPAWVEPRLADARSALSLAWSHDAARATADLVAEVRPDVAHIQHVHRHLTPSVLEPLRRAGVPVVWTVHDYELICPEGHLFDGRAPCERCRGHHYWQAAVHRCKWGQVLPSVAVAAEKALHHRLGVWNKVDRFLCPSAFLARKLVEFGVPEERVRVLPNALDAGLPASGGGEGWLVAGRLSPEKGVDVAIAAARLLPGHRLWICGDGPERGRLEAAAPPDVRFLGHLPRERLARLIREVAVVAVPSRWWENLPYAVLEAQAAGRAVVASAMGGIPEQIDNGVDGLLVPAENPPALAEAVGGLLADPERAHRLGAAAAARVRRDLAPDAHLAAILAHYREVGA